MKASGISIKAAKKVIALIFYLLLVENGYDYIVSIFHPRPLL